MSAAYVRAARKADVPPNPKRVLCARCVRQHVEPYWRDESEKAH